MVYFPVNIHSTYGTLRQQNTTIWCCFQEHEYTAHSLMKLLSIIVPVPGYNFFHSLEKSTRTLNTFVNTEVQYG